ncbi:MAG: hypothetical protein KME21_19300 [Desmonostoc vinosum HA7617-LM4]|nr:hypothetical protein [Desmonostoc vinosum HA7617-LM4]
MQNQCHKNRKRSRRRAIYCPIHRCNLYSMSQKYALYADQTEQLRQKGIARRNALILVATKTAVPLEGEWLEAFWCDQCKETKWYHVKKSISKSSGREISTYEMCVASRQIWQQASGVTHPQGNPSVGEFTRRHARMISDKSSKDFRLRVE